MEINLHDTIEKNENSMNNILYKDPYFNDLVKYQNESEKRKNKAKKLKNNSSFLIKNNIRYSTNSIIRKDEKKLTKNKSLPNLISVITNKINKMNENENIEKQKKRISKKFSFFGLSQNVDDEKEKNDEKLKNIPWIIRLKKNNPIKNILIPNKTIEEYLPIKLRKKQGNILQQVSMEKRKSIFLLPSNPKAFILDIEGVLITKSSSKSMGKIFCSLAIITSK